MSEGKRIRPPARFEDLLDKLTREGPFETKQAAMMFAAATGVFIGKPEPVGKAAEGIRWDIFERNEDTAFINALAISDSESIQILDEEKQEQRDPVQIFEEYAAAGLQYISDHCVNVAGDELDNLLNLLAEARMRHSEPPPGLEGLTPADLEFLGGTDR